MGIQGIYKEIGPGERVSLAKLAARKFEEANRPLRIAVDTSIWLFQIQSGKGGTNPALRTFYYRLLRLISLSIHPIFVFDGPNKPPIKRNKRTGPNIASIPEFLAKQLLKQFGIPFHQAPGEAEAECALLQREGIVDAVVTEDVDTLMFGCGMTLRNWSPEPKSSKVVSHVNVYDAAKTKETSGLDREGLVLVALMSGGDYSPDGIPGCGPKIACEAARAGFGHELCNLSRRDRAALGNWRERLQHELRTNESKLFKTKHAALLVPEDFPRSDLLGWYMSPVVSSPDKLVRLRESLQWDSAIDFKSLRTFTAEAFDWSNLGGAKKFIRNLATALIVRNLRLRGSRRWANGEVEDRTGNEGQLVKGIHGQRTHATTDESKELRISFLPIEIVDIDLDAEEPDTVLPEDENDSEEETLPGNDNEDGTTPDVPKRRSPSNYDPTQLEKLWILETFVKVGAPLAVKEWEASQLRRVQKKAASNTQKGTRSQRAKATGGMQQGALDRYAKVTKPGITRSRINAKAVEADAVASHASTEPASQVDLPVRSTFRAPQDMPTTPRKVRQISVIDLLSPHVATNRPLSTEMDIDMSTQPTAKAVPKRRKGPFRRTQTLPTDLSANNIDEPCLEPDIEISGDVDDLTFRAPASFSQSRSNAGRPRIRRSNSIHASTRAMQQWLQSSRTMADDPSMTRQSHRTLVHPPIEEVDLTDSPIRPSVALTQAGFGSSSTANRKRGMQAPPSAEAFGSNNLPPYKTTGSLAPVSGNSARGSCSSSSSFSSLPKEADEKMDKPQPPKSRKRFVQVRQSLQGAWEVGTMYEGTESVSRLGTRTAWAQADIEIVDLLD